MWSANVSYLRLVLEFLIGLVFTIYIIVISVLSPCPPLLEHWSGEVLIILSWVIIEFVFMRVRCLVASKLEKISNANTLLTLGIVTLLGQVLGGLLGYIGVDIFRILKSRPDCIFDISHCKSENS